jgi:hypothetical protein
VVDDDDDDDNNNNNNNNNNKYWGSVNIYLYVWGNNYKPATIKIIASKDDFVVGRCIKFPNTQTKIITLSHNSIITPGFHIM